MAGCQHLHTEYIFTQYSFINKALGVKSDTLYYNKPLTELSNVFYQFLLLGHRKVRFCRDGNQIKKKVTLTEVKVVGHL